MINLETVEFENFLSFEGLHTYNFDNKGMHFIQGINKDSEKLEGYSGTLLLDKYSVGSGKTTFTQVAMYALYGEITKKINKDDVINKNAARNCRVKLFFNKDNTEFYYVERFRKHSEFQNSILLFKKISDNWEDISYEDNEETQEYINKITRLNDVTFRRASLFHRDDTQHFMDLNNTKRSALFENITTQFDNLQRYFFAVKNIRKEISNKISEEEMKLLKERTIAEQNIKTVKNAKEFLEEKNTDIKKQIYEINIEINKLLSIVNAEDFETLKEKIKKFKEYKKIIVSLEKDNEKIVNDISLISDKIKTLNKSVIFTQKVIKSKEDEFDNLELITCDNCGHILKFSEEQRNKIKSELLEQKDHLLSLVAENNKQRELEKELGKSQDANNNSIELFRMSINGLCLNDDIEKIIDEIDIIKKIDDLKQQIILLEHSLSTYKKNFISTSKKIKLELEKNKNTISDLKVKLKQLHEQEDYAEFWNEKLNIREENSIKQFLMLTIIPVFNFLLQKILDYVYHGDLTISFDTYFNEALIKNGKDYKYHELSTGEKLKLNLCISLAIFDLTRINMSGVSILFIDEVLTNVDEPTIKTFLNLFKEKYSVNSAVFVISHQNNVKDNIDPKTITYITKEYDKSTIKVLTKDGEIEDELY